MKSNIVKLYSPSLDAGIYHGIIANAVINPGILSDIEIVTF